jgi:hypothetical protein
MATVAQSSVGWQNGFLAVLPAIQTHAQIQFRRLPALRREEAVQEAVAAACVSYQILASKGRLHVAHPGTLAEFAVRHVRNGRHVGGHQDSARDVISPTCQQRHHLRVRSVQTAPSGCGTDGWRQVAIADRKADIPDLAAFRIDFGDWLRTLAPRDRRIINRMAAGERTMDVADRFRISWGRVSQLRRRFERNWRAFQGEELVA